MKKMHFRCTSEFTSYSLTFIKQFVCEERGLQYSNIWLIRELDCPEMFGEKPANGNFFKTFRFTRNLNNLLKPKNSLYIMRQSGRTGSKTF